MEMASSSAYGDGPVIKGLHLLVSIKIESIDEIERNPG